MGLPKGRTNNLRGKPSGTKCKKTLEWEAIGKDLTGRHTANVNKLLDKLYKNDPDAFLRVYTMLIEYFKPKLARTELTGKDGKEPLTINFTPAKTNDSKTD